MSRQRKRRGRLARTGTVLLASFALIWSTAAPAAADPTNPDQVDGPGIITVQQINMCMWGSVMIPDPDGCYGNPYGDDSSHPQWAEEEQRIAGLKRDSVVTQFDRHIPDVMTVTEGCLHDLEAVAQDVGYDIRYQELGAGAGTEPRQCTVGRGPQVNAIMAEEFGEPGPQGYFESDGYRAYLCTEVSTDEWASVQVCTAHLSLRSQHWGGREHHEIECGILRNDILDDAFAPDEYVIFAGDVNRGGGDDPTHCMPDRYHGLKNLERLPEDRASNPLDGLLHIYYTANEPWRQTSAWSYNVSATDHEGFLLELGVERPPNRPPCWRVV